MNRRLGPLFFLLLGVACARSAEAPAGPSGESGPLDQKQKSAPEPSAPPRRAAEPAPAPAAAEDRAFDAPKSTRGERAEPATLAEAEAELALAERELDSLLGPGAGAGAEQKGAGAAASPCERTCRAFASLARAAQAVCRLEQPNADRCARANDAVGRARSRVSSCACSP